MSRDTLAGSVAAPGGLRPWRAWSLGIGLAAAATSAGLGYAALVVGHPAEDAYILYRYAENLAAGHGIAFNAGGPRAEGATDFLWLLLLAAPVRLGADVALAALAWNSLGAGCLAALLARVFLRAGLPTGVRLALAGLSLSVVLSSGAVASYVGFSAMLFSALAVLILAVAVEARGRRCLALPVLGLVLALFRPEGVVLGVAYTVLGVVPARRSGWTRPYLATSAAAALAGLGYFAWRTSYFGLLLPLPLLIKGRGAAAEAAPTLLRGVMESLPGLVHNVGWLGRPEGPLPLLAALAVLVWAARGGGRPLRRLGLGLVPSALLYLLLLVPVQSQNVSWRFQAPIFMALLYALSQSAAWALERGSSLLRWTGLCLVLLAGFAPSLAVGLRAVASIRHLGSDYLDTFAALLGAELGEGDRVALTEAGRIPYWTSARVEDLVGLNSPHTARRPPSLAYLRALDPEVVMFHHAGTLDLRELAAPAAGRPWIEVPAEALGRAPSPRYADLFRRDVASYRDTDVVSARIAAIALARYLAGSADYDVVLVDAEGNGAYYHVYGFRKGPRSVRLRSVLARLLEGGGYLSYLDLKRSPIRFDAAWDRPLPPPPSPGGRPPGSG
jgi:hypothetical protein